MEPPPVVQRSPAPAAAEGRDTEVRQKVGKFADPDLKRSAGIALLYGRIKAAALDVCEPLDSKDL
jgi:UrcA family protein